MKIAFIVDGRAEHARRWIQYFAEIGDDVLVLSTYPCNWNMRGVRCEILPGIFRPGNAFAKVSDGSEKNTGWFSRYLIGKGLDNIVRPIWHRMNVFDAFWQGYSARRHLRDFGPDVIHSMRIQNEGYVAAIANYRPWIASVWGQDFFYYAKHYATHRLMTKWTLPRVPALTADCERDIRMAHDYGLRRDASTAVFPGNGGVDRQVFSLDTTVHSRPSRIVYGRGFGPYLRLENLLSAVSELKQDYLLCLIGPPAQLPRIGQLADANGIPLERVELLSYLNKREWARVLQTSRVMVSPSVSDGTPNTMLEAMACGTLPVMGDIESIREWIRPGINGLLFDPEDPVSIQRALERALVDDGLLQSAAKINQEIIDERANSRRVFPAIREFYKRVTAEQNQDGNGDSPKG